MPNGLDERTGRRWAAVGLMVSAASAALLTALVVNDAAVLARIDEPLTDFTRSWADSWEWPVTLAHEISNKTGVIWSSFVAGLFALFLFARRRWGAGAFLMLSALLGGLIGLFMKDFVSRQRPPGAELFESDLTDSFPSGHTMVGIYLYLAVGLVLLRIGQANDRRWMAVLGWAFIVFGPFLGLTRIVVGAHWPTDVLGGWAFGSVVVCLCALLCWDPMDRQWLTWRRRSGSAAVEPPAASGSADGPP